MDQVRIKAFMLADSAQAVGGKLYVLGGGFDRVHVPSVPATIQFALAVLLEVPWTATNQPCRLEVQIVDADGQPVDYKAELTVETGRPPGTRKGASFSVPLVIPVVAGFHATGCYDLRASIDGAERERVTFEVMAPAVPAQRP